jgi:uroporphyrin-III C-methyltransferase
MRLSPIIPAAIRAESGLLFLIGLNPDRPGELSWPALAALMAADAVVHDADVDPDTLALVPSRCFVEAAPVDIARVRKLASEGWRVVWLVVGDPAKSLATLANAERLAEAGITIRTIASLWSGGPDGFGPIGSLGDTPVPQSFATALNGLAG